ncbi:hypothetical protein DVH05_006112 [Phytophthora capsici]|nr:hypothetical protein DVH05_006112 [Phytophthora capsici]
MRVSSTIVARLSDLYFVLFRAGRSVEVDTLEMKLCYQRYLARLVIVSPSSPAQALARGEKIKRSPWRLNRHEEWQVKSER